MRYYIGMDVGGTYARLKLADAHGQVLGTYENKGGTITSTSYETVRERYHTLIKRALDAHHLSAKDCVGLCLGASGIDTDALRVKYTQMLESFEFGKNIIFPYNDCELLLELYPKQPCVAIIAGTGSIIMSRKATGEIVRYGGWSYLLSDEGSASYIIRKAIEAVVRYWDGYGDCGILANLFEKETEMRNQQEASTYFIDHIRQKEMISRYAPLVEKAALLNDPTALHILETAAERLFIGTKVVVNQIDLMQQPLVVLLWGSVLMKNAFVPTRLRALIQANFPNSQVVSLEQSAVDCALDIAKRLGEEVSICLKTS
jgi:Predicted N-acetylglucosamine kinase